MVKLIDKISGLRKDINIQQFLMETLGLRLTEVYALLERELSLQQEKDLELAEWAINLGIPISRVFNRRFFYDSLFNISPFVLDPRPETEALVEYIIGLKPSSVLDLGTGSGCILLSILKETSARGTGVDLSQRALENARQNASSLNIEAEFLLGDFSGTYGKFEVIVVNPPYVTEEKIDRSCLFDPPISLFPIRMKLATASSRCQSSEMRGIRKDARYSSDEIPKPEDQINNKISDMYKMVIQGKNLANGGRLVLEIPELATYAAVEAGKGSGLELEASKEIGNGLYMLVMRSTIKAI